MNKAFHLFLIAYAFLVVISEAQGPSNSPTNEWAAKYSNSSNSPASSASSNSTYKDFYIKVTCPAALQKANKAISEFVASVKEAKNQWGAFSAAEKLNGFSYYLSHGCKVEDLKVVNKGVVGVNKTQDEACENLTSLIQPLIGQGGSSGSSNWMANFDISNKAFALQKRLGANCNLTVVQDEEPIVKVEEENQEPKEISEEATHPLHSEESPNEEEDDKHVPSLTFLSSADKNHIYSNYQDEENEEEEAEEFISEELVDQDNQDFLIRIDEKSNNQQDTYIIYYHPEPNGDADILIAHASIKEITESEQDYEEENNDSQKIEKLSLI